MELAAVLQARTLALMEVAELDRRGRLFMPDLINEIAQRYKFQKAPKTAEEMNEKKGVELNIGRHGDIVIDAFKIFDTMLVAETHSSTADSRRVIEDMLAYGKEKLGLTYEPTMIARWAYVSDLTFRSDLPILATNDPFSTLAHRVSEEVSTVWNEPITYEPTIITAGHDPTTRKNLIAPFTIQRRANDLPFSQNKYFSEAPLPTQVHWRLLEEFEQDVLKSLPTVDARAAK
jgi:hypothetical protein